MRGDLRAVFVGGQEKLARITIDENGTEATEIVDGAITHRDGMAHYPSGISHHCGCT